MKTAEHLLQGNAFFQRNYFRKHESQLLDLVAHGQHPRALFIGCADSRVIPSLITNAPPGQLFVLRNVGNFVAPYKPDEDYHATAAGIEYAVTALNVAEVIICGHTHCGAIAALFTGKDEGDDLIHTRKWLSLGKKAREMAMLALGKDAEPDRLLRLTEIWCAMNGVPAIVIFEGGQSELLANVVAQIYAHLLQHPSRDPVGLAVYVELRYMTASLMLGEWFE